MKKKWLSRTIAAMLAGVMSVSMLAACGQEQEETQVSANTSTESTPATEPSSEEVEESGEITYPLEKAEEISIFVYEGIPVADVYASADESPWHSGLEKQTGVDIDWQYPAKGADPQALLNLMWQDEELPSIVYGQCTSLSNTVTWLEDGLIWDLTEYVPKYAPDYWEFLNRPENADEKKAMMTDDGKILALYGASESQYNVTYLGPVVRQDWLDECGLEAPRTLEEWEKVLEVFKEKYNATLAFRFGRYNTSGGISSGTGAQAPLTARYYLNDNNQVCYGTYGPEWKAMLEVLNRWYEKGYLSPDFATDDDTTVRAKALNGEIGVAITAMSQLTNWEVDAKAEGTGANWVGFQYPATEVGAPITYHYVKRCLASAYGACITTGCTEEEMITALKFLNYGYTEEGMMYHNFGVEGETYTVDAKGNVVWTDLITKDEGGLDAAVRKYCGTHTGTLVTIQMEQFVKAKNSEAAGEAVYKWVENTAAKDYQMPTVVLTEEENAAFAELNTALSTYVAEMALKFVTGKESLDKYEDFEKTLNEMGLAKCLEIQQAAVDRYFGK